MLLFHKTQIVQYPLFLLPFFFSISIPPLASFAMLLFGPLDYCGSFCFPNGNGIPRLFLVSHSHVLFVVSSQHKDTTGRKKVVYILILFLLQFLIRRWTGASVPTSGRRPERTAFLRSCLFSGRMGRRGYSGGWRRGVGAPRMDGRRPFWRPFDLCCC